MIFHYFLTNILFYVSENLMLFKIPFSTQESFLPFKDNRLTFFFYCLLHPFFWKHMVLYVFCLILNLKKIAIVLIKKFNLVRKVSKNNLHPQKQSALRSNSPCLTENRSNLLLQSWLLYFQQDQRLSR